MEQILAAVQNWFIAILALSALAGVLRSPVVKGWLGEAQGALAKRLLLDKNTYITINDITLPTPNGTTQIDHVVVSRHGIFVIETKNMKGWIFGDEKSRQWTQNVFGRKFRFQNPLHQNYRHIRALADFLQLDDDRFHSVVMFWGSATFKTPMPENVLTRGYTSYIKSKRDEVFSDEEVSDIVTALRTGMLPRTFTTRREHIASLKARHESTAICPRCASPLVRRVGKSGRLAGREFYGCSTFPRCRFARAL